MRKTCVMCRRTARAYNADGAPNYLEVKGGAYQGNLCMTCATALEVGGVELRGFEPTPRKLQRGKKPKKGKGVSTAAKNDSRKGGVK